MLVAMAGVWTVLRRAAADRAAARQEATGSASASRAPATSASSLP
jgi:hypothetical protein